ncbi:DUF3846 domain-containing protein [Planococcus lenghuensis]|uniref:DUF3846 domain-containing protein n=1 Tax=Planococcus lenghuensis TaxID=2213202 RepID=A0A1Q2L4H9_9BACL|nr:DUF3846 domain-containing protein [Planococcus lenghuensis]AQQ55365.1 hypothetical protein B0X71_19530 [Planococcus lenghuensis]
MEKENTHTFLGRKPGESGWIEVGLKDLSDMQAFVEGYIERIEIGCGIDLWVNDSFLAHAASDTLSLMIKREDAKLQTVYGNVFVATSNDEGDIVPLSKDQMKWFTFRFKEIKQLFSDPFLLITDIQSFRKVGELLWQ